MLLGPPRVERDGSPVAFDTRKAMALLAVLALVERPRPRDVLAELLWPEHDAEHARGALRRTLSTLRSAIGPEAVDATRDRVSLVRGASLEVDVDRFRALAAAGDLEAAIAEFRGELLEGFGLRDAPAFEDWQRGEADALRRELATVLARHVEATGDLALARRWLELDPLHEPAHRALIRLYARSGDRAAALGQYRECVRTLSRELGVPPLAETTRLYEAISEGTLEGPAAADDAPAPAQPAPRAAPLVGREDDRRALVELHRGIGADGRVAVLEGEAGIGKTRLAEELIADARERGAALLCGRAYEEESALAYGPLVAALRERLREDPAWVAAVPERALAEAARLLPDLSAAAPPPLDGPAAQARFLDGVWETLAVAAAGAAPGILFIDDAQWADEATIGLLAYGLRRLAGRPLLVLLTWRTSAPGRPPARRGRARAQRGRRRPAARAAERGRGRRAAHGDAARRGRRAHPAPAPGDRRAAVPARRVPQHARRGPGVAAARGRARAAARAPRRRRRDRAPGARRGGRDRALLRRRDRARRQRPQRGGDRRRARGARRAAG